MSLLSLVIAVFTPKYFGENIGNLKFYIFKFKTLRLRTNVSFPDLLSKGKSVNENILNGQNFFFCCFFFVCFLFLFLFFFLFFVFLLSVDLLTESYELFPQKAQLCLTDSEVRICRQCLNILWTFCLREQKKIRDFKRPGASNILKAI